ncbi:MAG: hypothetical protein QW561_00485 [Candidatus Aenigmatarchaeota archaeon]
MTVILAVLTFFIGIQTLLFLLVFLSLKKWGRLIVDEYRMWQAFKADWERQTGISPEEGKRKETKSVDVLEF